MTGNLQPLDQKFPIVDPATGKPTLYFIKWAQQKQIDISGGITADQAAEIIQQYLDDHTLQQGNGISISPSGNLSDNPTIALNAGLDDLTDVDLETTPPTDGQALVFDEASSLWIPGAGGGGGGSSRVLAAGHFIGSDPFTSITLAAGTNIASITRTAQGRYRVTFSVPLMSTKVSVLAGCKLGAFNDNWTGIVGIDRHIGSGVATTHIDLSISAIGAAGAPNGLYDPVLLWVEVSDPANSGGGGGGGGNWWFSPPLASYFPTQFGTPAINKADDPDEGLLLNRTGSATGLRGFVKAISAGINFSATMRMTTAMINIGAANVCMVIGNAALSKFGAWGWDSRFRNHFIRMTPTTYDGFEINFGAGTGMPNWYRLHYETSTGIVSLYLSGDGKQWSLAGTNAIKTYLSGDPAYLGLGLVTEGYSALLPMAVQYWEDDAI